MSHLIFLSFCCFFTNGLRLSPCFIPLSKVADLGFNNFHSNFYFIVLIAVVWVEIIREIRNKTEKIFFSDGWNMSIDCVNKVNILHHPFQNTRKRKISCNIYHTIFITLHFEHSRLMNRSLMMWLHIHSYRLDII